MLLVTEYLKNHSLNDLEREYGVNFRFSACGTKISLNYDQISAKNGEPLSEQCRGLVIQPIKIGGDGEINTPRKITPDEIVGYTYVLARPMDRFYNLGDVHAEKLDPASTVFEEKLDGTCCIVYFDRHKNEWCVATRSVCEADLPTQTPIGPMTFAELFKKCVEKTLFEEHGTPLTFDEWVPVLDQDVTYVYEMTCPLNRVVVKYTTYRVTLLAARVTDTGKYITEYVPQLAALQRPKKWVFNTIDDLVNFVESCDPQVCEGAIMVDARHNRVKVKSKAWVVASRAKELMLSPRKTLECIIDGTMDAIIPCLDDEIVGHLKDTKERLHAYAKGVNVRFAELKSVSATRKEFALNVQRSGEWQSPYFALISGHAKCTLSWLKYLSENEKLTPTILDSLVAITSKN